MQTAVVVQARHEDVALITPVLGPGVLDDPVVSALQLREATLLPTNHWVGSEANGEHLMVKIVVCVAAVRLVVHTRAVENEGLAL